MKRRHIFIAAKISISVLLLFLVYRNVSTTSFVVDVRQMKVLPLLGCLALLFFNTFISALKWQLFLRADNINIPLTRLFSNYLISSFFNLILPSNIGGDVYRVASLGKDVTARSAASVLADRLSGFVALATIGTVASLSAFVAVQHKAVLFAPPALLAVLIAGILAIAWRKPFTFVVRFLRLDRIKSVDTFLSKLLSAFDVYRRNPALLIRTMGISFLFQFSIVVCVFLITKAVLMDIPFDDFCIFVPFVGILEAIPISMYGVGLRDAGYLLFFTEAGVASPEQHALSVSVLYIAITVLYTLAGGILFIHRLRRASEQSGSVAGKLDRTSGAVPPLNIAVMLRHIGDKGGITVYTRNILDRMLRIGVRHRFTLFYASSETMGAWSALPNVQEVLLPSPQRNVLEKLAWDQFRIPFALSSHHVDVLFNPKLSLPMAAGVPCVLPMHGMEQFAASDIYMWHDRLYFKATTPIYCRIATTILCATEAGKQDIVRYLGVPPEKVRVIPYSFNGMCRPINDDAVLDAARRKYGLPENFILFVGGVTPLKNVPTLAKAFAEIRPRFPKHKLVLAGFRRWKFRRDLASIRSLDLENEVLELGSVTDEDLPSLYNTADCLVLPSLYEGFGIPIPEAQACGCPVIISDVPTMREVAGDAALTFSPLDCHALAECITRVLTDESLRRSLSTKGIANASRYSWERTARETLDAIEQAAMQSPVRQEKR